MNDYYTAPDQPVDFTRGRAAPLRAAFDGIEAAFDKLPPQRVLYENRANYAVAGGTANALTAAMLLAPEEYSDGLNLDLKVITTNTGPATLNVDGLGAVPIQSNAGVALTGGELVAGSIVPLTYVGGVFRLPATGPRGPQGDVGPPGGRTIYNGAGAPDNSLGANGDFYINTAAWNLHGPKAGGVWPAGVAMLGTDGDDGDDGTDGKTLRYGVGDPGGGVGADGDFYIDTGDWQIFGPKAGGVWPAGVSLIGPEGDDGPPGSMDTSDVAFTGANTVQPTGDATAYEIGFRDLPISRSEAGNFTLALADRGKAIRYTDSGDEATVPLNSTVALPVGSIISIINDGSGNLSIKRADAAITLKLMGTGATGNKTLAVGGYATLHKVATNTWYVGGPGVS